jgi:hypothetical protein
MSHQLQTGSSPGSGEGKSLAFWQPIICSEPLLVVLMFVSANPELVAGISVRSLFLELPVSPLVDFLVICLSFACVDVLYPLPGTCKLPLDAMLEWSPTTL